ncbi:HNH endonuclease [Saccharopolyspora karakumensis]|uniref:HNH endonuclease n=1 Tax=Saccharopolyspora karakumensis TaxID=2530386 RepID=A0A4R5BY03_9PSEU|nr:HNH endonuclease [Saccharopolyspora karakumensis]TDD92081.1 HNH endonuclease [Saccharopolyspora karakumensis]
MQITRAEVLAAIAEYDALGRETFLSRYGFDDATSYLLHHAEERYEAAAVLAAAHGYLPDRSALRASELPSRKNAVELHLRRLRFDVRRLKSPSWERDEVILACDLVRQNGWHWLSADDQRVQELSELLQLMPLHPAEVRGPKFRNVNGVARKTADIATQHPDYRGKPTKGGALDREVLADFLKRPEEMQTAANTIRAGLQSGMFEGLAASPDDIEDTAIAEASEGRLLERRHYARERNPKLRKRKIDAALKERGRLQCEVCDFDFEAAYCERGRGYIECHHVVPLHTSGETTNRLQDLVLICANCHRMIHRGTPWLTPDELRLLVRRGWKS